MSSGRIICFYVLVLYVLTGASGLKCYIGKFNKELQTIDTQKLCAVYIALDCLNEPEGYFDVGYADIRTSLCVKTLFHYVCYCDTDYCNMDFPTLQELWKKSPDNDKKSDFSKCIMKVSRERKFALETRSTIATESIVTTTTESNTTEKEHTTYTTTSHQPGTIEETTEEPGALKGSEQEKNGDKGGKESGDIDMDFIIFLILVIVAAILLIAIIPTLIGCIIMKSKRDKSRRQARDERAKSLRSNKSRKSDKSAKTTSTKSAKTGSSMKSHGNSTRSGDDSAKNNRSNITTRSSRKEQSGR
ncbi:hypothetical protein RB195_016073 [Necator americanus]|uniref:Uncharacterized protein n=1 Tax=Necator americanus TaxID=51031 RepID=A0ABR1E7G4_NECAM